MSDDVVLKIGKGQGFTQALKQYLQKEGKDTNFSVDIWNDVIDTAVEIDNNRKKDGATSIFKGGSDRSDYKKNLLVMPGEIKLSDKEMGLILEKIKSKTEPKVEPKTEPKVEPLTVKTPTVEAPKIEPPKVEPPKVDPAPVAETKSDEVTPSDEKIVAPNLSEKPKFSQKSITNEDGSITTTTKNGDRVTISNRKIDPKTRITTYVTENNGATTTLKVFKIKMDDKVYVASVNMNEETKTLKLSEGFVQELGRPHKLVYSFEQENRAGFKEDKSLLDMRRWQGIE